MVSGRLQIQAFFDQRTQTVTYLVIDASTGQAAVIDPVLDFDAPSGQVSLTSANRVLAAVDGAGADLRWILETHAHADHLSAAQYLKRRTGASLGMGERIGEVRRIFRPVFNLEGASGDGSEFDHLFSDGERFAIGDLSVEVMHTPGHTPACVSYRIEDAVFVGDTLFMPDYGTARADFPGGDASTLYRSIQKLLALPPQTRMFLCHDYLPEGRAGHVWETTVAEQLAHNIHVGGEVSEAAFVAMRQARDATLAAPTLLLPSIQVNVRAGQLPRAEDNGVRYLKTPLRLPADWLESSEA